MPSLRTSIPDADLQRSNFDWSFFLKLTVGGIYGTKRYTDLARGAVDSFTGNVDGTSQTWTWRELICPGFNQDNAGIESVQYVEIDNLDYELATIGADVGLMGTPYELWKAWFALDRVTIDGAYLASSGLIDDVAYGNTARLTLKANNTYWSRRILGPPLGPLCPYYYRDVDTCQYSGIASYTITAGGSGYPANPPVTVAAPAGGGVTATALATATAGVVTSVVMVTAGSGYGPAEVPTVTFTGVGGGSGAAAHGNAEPAGQTTCPKKRADCVLRLNQAKFGGLDLALPPNTILYWQNQQITAGGGAVTPIVPATPIGTPALNWSNGASQTHNPNHVHHR